MIQLCNKDQQNALFSLIYFNNHPPHVSNRLPIHHQEVALLYMQHMVFIMLKILNLCKITYIVIVIESIKHCILCKVSDYTKSFFNKKVVQKM
jgi:hypothetical protein